MALVSLEEFKSYLGLSDNQLWIDGLRVFVNSGPTTATVEVKTHSLEIVTTGGATPGTYTWDLTNALYDTLSELVLSLLASPAGITAEAITAGAALSDDLVLTSATNCLGETNAQTLRIVDNYRLNNLLIWVSGEVEKYCGFDFEEAEYSERYDGNGEQILILNQRPVNRVTRLELEPVGVVTISNSSSTATRAFVRVDSTTMTLTAGTGATVSTNVLTLADYATLTLLEAAVNASVSNGYADFSPTDLAVTESLYCLDNSATLDMFTKGEQNYTLYPNRGWLYLENRFTRGQRNVLVVYNAGYANIPAALELAVLRILSSVYYQSQTDPNLTSERLGDYSWSKGKSGSTGGIALQASMEDELSLWRKYFITSV